jgi:uncharacterized Zn finger protein
MCDTQFPIAISCPWCDKGETLADKTADIKISCQCPKCGNFYQIDLKNQRSLKAKAKPSKASQPKKNTRAIITD